MNNFDKESRIIDFYRHTSQSNVLLCTNSDSESELWKSLIDNDRFANWIDMSGKGDPPPDYYNDVENLMMDVMRVDDHPKKNHVNAKESKIQKEIANSGLLEIFPNVQNIFVNSVCGNIPTEKDHSFQFYVDNFQRVVNEHKRKIESVYQKNHPNHKTIFFIMDETSGGYFNNGEIYTWWNDRNFLDCIFDSNIDYIIWFTPYIHQCAMFVDGHEEYIDFPHAVIMDVVKYKHLPLNLKHADVLKMMPIEV